MRSWFKDLMQRNRGEGPKPSGLCLWQDLQGMQQAALELTADALASPDNWEELQSKLSLHKEKRPNP